jgi:hypothetical protein
VPNLPRGQGVVTEEFWQKDPAGQAWHNPPPDSTLPGVHVVHIPVVGEHAVHAGGSAHRVHTGLAPDGRNVLVGQGWPRELLVPRGQYWPAGREGVHGLLRPWTQ